MKHLTLALILTVFCSLVKAQLNKSQSQIMQLMANDDKWKFSSSGHNKAGELYLSYHYKEKNWTEGFYFKNDSCGMIIIIIPNDQLGDVIKDMNRKFTSNGHNLWIDNNEKIYYSLILTDGAPCFNIYEVPSSSIKK